jgi:enolase-phosphatase E1
MLAVVVDIEGTTSSITYVHDHLFPYSRERLPGWLAEHADSPEVVAALADTRELSGRPDADTEELVAILRGWIDEDRKAGPLKTVQGLIWADGYARGELRSHVYADVPPALRSWTAAGRPVYVYSSGSVLAQRQWFGHCPQGDLLPYLAGHFDTANAGPKRESASYRSIAEQVGVAGAELLFLSDVRGTRRATRAGRWSACGGRTRPRSAAATARSGRSPNWPDRTNRTTVGSVRGDRQVDQVVVLEVGHREHDQHDDRDPSQQTDPPSTPGHADHILPRGRPLDFRPYSVSFDETCVTW